MAESAELREDKPNPVSAFLRGAKFSKCVGVNGGLGVEETMKVHVDVDPLPWLLVTLRW